MDKAEITRFQKCKTCFGVRMDICLVEKVMVIPDQVGPVKNGIC